ncbi:PE family protein, partial [Mycobacterium kansasii]
GGGAVIIGNGGNGGNGTGGAPGGTGGAGGFLFGQKGTNGLP